MIKALVIALAVLPVGIVYASFAEWIIHSWLMHRPFFRLRHFFHGHAKVHHRRYQSGATYAVGDRARTDLTFAWWAMPFPVLFHVPFLMAIALWLSLPAALGLLVAFILYQASYEYLHYCMHVPTGRWFEGSWVFRWIDAHHRQHHRKYGTNLNVVLPIADFLLRTRRRPHTASPTPHLSGARSI